MQAGAVAAGFLANLRFRAYRIYTVYGSPKRLWTVVEGLWPNRPPAADEAAAVPKLKAPPALWPARHWHYLGCQKRQQRWHSRLTLNSTPEEM